jgi:hypothetical protein
VLEFLVRRRRGHEQALAVASEPRSVILASSVRCGPCTQLLSGRRFSCLRLSRGIWG